MRKSTKLLILVAALVALCSMVALAANTWKQEGDQWFCYDSEGNVIYGAWQKSGSNWYYLDDATGAMVTNKLIETDGFKYWCGEDGARVLQKWVQVPVDNNGDGYEWMFFKALTGKAMVSLKDTEKKIENGFQSVKNSEGVTRKYLFDGDGYMLYGYLADLDGNKADDIVAASYYLGPKDEGWQRTEWMKFVDGELTKYEDKTLVYFYLKNSKKITKADHDEESGNYKVSTGKYYYFAEDGKLLTGWQGTGSTSFYLGAADDGLMKKKVWNKTDDVWKYLGADGHPYCATESDAERAADTNAQIKKVGAKYYLFDEFGKMLTGIAVINTEDELDPAADGQYAVVLPAEVTKSSFADEYELAYEAGDRIYYFNTDADNDGSMKTGVQTITIDGDEITAYFDKHGCAYEGIVSNKIYNNGVLKAAGEQKYVVAYCNLEEDYYLVNAAGAIVKNSKVCDADGIWYVVVADDDDYEIFKFANKDYSANAASAFKNEKLGFKIGNQWYAWYVDEAATEKAKGQYVVINWEKVDEEPKAK